MKSQRFVCSLIVFAALGWTNTALWAQDEKASTAESSPLLDSILNVKEDQFEESANPITKRILKEDPVSRQMTRPSQIGVTRELISVSTKATPVVQNQQFLQQLVAIVNKRLRQYKTFLPSPGINKVTVNNLDPKWVERLVRPVEPEQAQPGLKFFAVEFDDMFYHSVRATGMQLQLKEEGRFRVALNIAAYTFAALLLLYGALKLINTRAAARRDHLSTSQISMV